MKCLVTGGAGFIGSNLVLRLLNDGHDVRILDNFSTGQRSNIEEINDDVEITEGDIRSYERCHAAVKGMDLVFHLAALPSVPRSIQDPLTTNEVNITGTLNILLASRDENVRRVIYASSSSAYGNSKMPSKAENHATNPLSPYANSKLAAEHYCAIFKEIYGLDTVSLRYFNVFGPRQNPFSEYAAVVPKFILSVPSGNNPVIYGDGMQSRDFTYVDNVVNANVLAAEKETVDSPMYNIAMGSSHTILDLIVSIESALDVSLVPKFEPRRTGDVVHSLADISRAKTELGYKPIVAFNEGILRTASWFSQKAYNSRGLNK